MVRHSDMFHFMDDADITRARNSFTFAVPVDISFNDYGVLESF
jgi:hypothetical protein